MWNKSLIVFLVIAAGLCGSCGGGNEAHNGCNEAYSGGNGDDRLIDKAVPPDKQDIFTDPDKVTLYTIYSRGELSTDEQMGMIEGSESLPLGNYKGTKYFILDSIELAEDEVAALISTFVDAVNQGEEAGIACFFPHHALRIEKDGETLDILICFMCHNYLVHPGGGYNNVHMSKEVGMEEAWREVVRAHGLKDISDDD